MGPTVSAHRAAPELPIGAARPLAAYPIGLGRRLADFRVNDELRHAEVPVNDVEIEGKGWLDADLVKRTCHLFVGLDDVTEVVLLGATCVDGSGVSVMRGFYRGAHAEEIVADLAKLTSCDSAYFRFNPLRQELLARGRLKPSVDVEAAADSDVTRQKWLVLAVEPVRRDRDGRELIVVASTDAEQVAAFEAIDRIADNMARLGLPDPVLARSGNGAYCMWPIDLPADSKLPAEFVAVVTANYGGGDVRIDANTVGASAKISLFGTMDRTGEASDERPQRFAALVNVPWRLVQVGAGSLARVIGQLSNAPAASEPRQPPATTGLSTTDLAIAGASRAAPTTGPATASQAAIPQYELDLSQLASFVGYLRGRHAPFGATELAYVSLDGAIHAGLFDDELAMVHACAGVTDARSCYFAVNPVAPSTRYEVTNCFARGARAGKLDIASTTLVLVDFDVVAPGRKQAATRTGHKKAPCTDEEHELAVRAATAFAALYAGSFVVATNGAQVWIPVSLVGTNEELNTFAAHNVKGFLREVQAWWEAQPFYSPDLHVDLGMWDLSRLAALPGTWKRDGVDTRYRHHRIVQIVRVGSGDGCADLNARLSAPVVALDKNAGRARRQRQQQASGQQNREASTLEPHELLCAGRNHLLMRTAAHPTHGRSAVLFALTRMLDEAGVHHDDVVQIVLDHDAALGQKLVDRFDKEQYVETAIASDKSAPGCTWIQRANADVTPCLGCQHFRRSKNAPKAFVLKQVDQVPHREHVDLSTARTTISASINEYLEGGPVEHALLVGGPPGLGKTTILAGIVAAKIDAGVKGAIVVDRLDLADDLARMINRPECVKVLRGMDKSDGEQAMCLAPERREEVRRAGLLGQDGALACDGCPKHEDCLYTRQFLATDKTWIMSSLMMPFRLKNGLFENGAHYAVLDEGAQSAYTANQWTCSTADVHRAVDAGLPVGFLLTALTRGEEPFGFHAFVQLRAEGRNPHEVFPLLRLANEINRSPEARQSKRVVPLAVIELLTVMVSGMKASSEHGHPNSRLELERNSVIVRNPRNLNIAIPTVILDSTGVPDVYAQVVGRPVVHVAPAVKTHATVLQLVSGRFGRASMGYKQTRSDLFDDVVQIVKAFGTHDTPVAVVTLKAYEIELQQRLEGHHATVLHYAATRGTNIVIDQGCRHIILAGTYAPNLDELLAWCRARAWSDAERIIADIGEVLMPLPGTNQAVPVLVAADKRVQPWLQMQGAGEMLQAAERLRTRIRPGPLHVWILSNQPVPDMEPDFASSNVTELIGFITDSPDDHRQP